MSNLKGKVLYAWLIVSLTIIAFLGTYIVKREPICERIHLDDIDRNRNVVFDEEMAKRIAEAYIDSFDEPLGWDEDFVYDVKVTFDEVNYEWIVEYLPQAPKGKMVVDGGKTARIRRDNGILSSYAWR